jgi:DNA-binding transcriptional ArsR family regulator
MRWIFDQHGVPTQLTTIYIGRRLFTMQAPGATLSALADPTRRQIVEHLATGTATVSELVGCFELSQPTISSHLKVLEHAGLIERSRVAQTRPCSLSTEGLRALGLWLGELRTVYEQNYGRLDGVLHELQTQQENPT